MIKDTRRRLLDAARAVICAQGYNAASVDDIASAAGLTKGAIYTHFASKRDVLLALIEEWEIAAQGSDAVAGYSAYSSRDTRPRGDDVLVLEFWRQAIDDPIVASRLRQAYDSIRDATSRAIGGQEAEDSGERADQLLCPNDGFAVLRALGAIRSGE